MEYPRIRVAVDRGGTFTDIYAEIDRDNQTTEKRVLKLLSVDPDNYADAPTEGIRRILEIATGVNHARDQPLETKHIQFIRMGTTIATNALLERKGEPCALVATEGLSDMLAIGNQSRPRIFDLKVKKMPVLYNSTVEAHERVRLDKTSLHDRDHVHTSVRVHKPLDKDQLRTDLQKIRDQGITSLAVALMHSYAFKDHELLVSNIAKDLGFSHVSLSSELTPMVKVVPRGFTAIVDAYLTPKVHDYIANFRTGFQSGLEGVDVQFMQSDGGLCDINDFCGYVAILSGPAGGVVGYARSLYGFEKLSPEVDDSNPPLPVIGFDMGGTSTDVSRYSGRFEHVFETETAGVTIQAPQLEINTVAAGGGSRLFYRNGMFYVGPESAGAHPGPVCYRKGGYLTITDANLLLGRIEPQLFPHIFGENADQPLDVEATRQAFAELTKTINATLQKRGEPEMTVEEIAEGFVKVANEAMCRPIRQLTEAKGFDVRDHSLACFGGAGGQHACAIARSLGIETVFVHKYSGVLSAYGIALADSVVEVQEPVDAVYGNTDSRMEAYGLLYRLRTRARQSLRARGFEEKAMRFEQYLNLRYDGTDFGIMVPCPQELNENPELVDFAESFTKEYSREYGFHLPGRKLVIDDVRVRALGVSEASKDVSESETSTLKIPTMKTSPSGQTESVVDDAVPALTSKCYYSSGGGWLETHIWRLNDLPNGKAVLPGPCVVVDTDAGNTIVVDPGCTARVSSDGNILINVPRYAQISSSELSTAGNSIPLDHVKLSIYSHRFMGIAEQMGCVLQRTAISTNIKERLDFSCALFDETGGLVANAPHVPVHLGAMQDAVRYQIRSLGDDWQAGEVILSNHPDAGGTHLPDITVVTPVHYDGKVVFYVASRGHHADIGGKTPGSMPPFSKSLDDEGLAIKTMKLVKEGVFQESEIVHHLEEAGCRCLGDVLSDLRAQVAANQKGINLVTDLIKTEGLPTVQSYMHHIQKAAADAVRAVLRDIARQRDVAHGQTLSFVDYMDDGTEINLALEINKRDGSAVFDFRKSGQQVEGNTNAPRSVTSSAVIYALRSLVDQDIPLNQGCLDPVTLKLAEASILSPSSNAAVVGGNVLTSQRVTDTILGAFGACAASQGCMNNFTFGDEFMGYYETIGGGAGAGPGWNGTSGVQIHMTNTRITDPEILERRYPAVVKEFALRRGSGGNGKWRGGDGLVRAIEFTGALTVCLLTERRERPPWGLNGGEPGAPGRNELIRNGAKVSDVGGKNTFKVDTGDVVRLLTPGGGGYGTLQD